MWSILPPRPAARRLFGLASDYHLSADTSAHAVTPLTLCRGTYHFQLEGPTLQTAHVIALGLSPFPPCAADEAASVGRCHRGRLPLDHSMTLASHRYVASDFVTSLSHLLQMTPSSFHPEQRAQRGNEREAPFKCPPRHAPLLERGGGNFSCVTAINARRTP